jgi:hypothetical protein
MVIKINKQLFKRYINIGIQIRTETWEMNIEIIARKFRKPVS